MDKRNVMQIILHDAIHVHLHVYYTQAAIKLAHGLSGPPVHYSGIIYESVLSWGQD